MSESKKNSILVVDDENANIMALTHILNPNYKVYAAKGGQGAIAAAEKYSPDIILLDVIMPEMDGYATIEALKASDKTKDIPVIFVTSLDSTGDEAWGLSLGAADYITKPFSSAIVKLRVNNQIKIVEQLRTIERLIMFDQVTDLPNRRSLIHRIKVEWERTLRKNKPLNILIINVDGFKKYSDSCGQEQGDATLQAIAKILTGTFERPSDFAARWGGEEFVLLLPNVEMSDALDTAEFIRKSVEGMTIPVPGKEPMRMTVSIGMNTQQEWWDGATTDEFIKEAYTKLYESKDNGGNQVRYIHKKDHNSI
ncbi:MAG: diguanylate cyclase [Oscillospiraceae bacterium]|jgi:diguanylate cyclase (GGDEF)-like protein|nr:diguanylate cyclase [Oscillospiraceae bacterium]